MKEKFPYIIGYAYLKSNLMLEEVGGILSDRLFGGATFVGKEKRIHDEVPAIFISKGILGLSVVLDGYEGMDVDKGYVLEILPIRAPDNVVFEDLRLDNYLTQILKIQLSDIKDIVVVEDNGG